jgi:hypothetical protein
MPDRDLARPRRVAVPNPSDPADDEHRFRAPDLELHDQLAGADAEAAELRQELDELRRRLDEPLPPVTPVVRRSHRPGRRAALGALVVGGTLGIVATGILVPWSDLRPGDGEEPATTGARPFAPTTAAPTVPADDAPAPRSVAAGTLPAAGPGIDRAGTVQALTIEADGSVLVVEQAVLGPRGQRGLQFALPGLSSLGGAVAGLTPRVSDLRVAVNGTPVRVTRAGNGRWTVDTGAARARTVRLSYRLAGSLLRSADRPGHSLVVSLPLLAQTLREQGLPMTVRASGANVRGVTCPGAPAAQMLCGTQDGAGWTATIPASATVPAALLQVDLKS